MRKKTPAQQAGFTMVAVMVSLAILLVIVAGSAAFIIGAQRSTGRYQDTEKAKTAAESGVQDLLAKLRLNNAYLEQLTDASGVIDPNGFCRDAAAMTPPAATGTQPYGVNECGWTAASVKEPAFKALPDGASYHYEVLGSFSPGNRTIDVLATGRSGVKETQVKARLTKMASRYLYFTNYELADPTDRTAYPDNRNYPGSQNTSIACGGAGVSGAGSGLQYAWEWFESLQNGEPDTRYFANKYGVTEPCRQPAFANGDVIGNKDAADPAPILSNDLMRFQDNSNLYAPLMTHANASGVKGLDCKGGVDPTDRSTWTNCLYPTSTNPWVGWAGSGPTAQPPEYLPGKLSTPTTDDIAGYAATYDAATAGTGPLGCRYYGPTRIIFEDGKMRVWSRQTKLVGPADLDPACGAPAAMWGSTGSRSDPQDYGTAGPGAVVDIPAGGLVVYVADMPGSSATGDIIPAGGIGGKAGRLLPLGGTIDTPKYANCPDDKGMARACASKLVDPVMEEAEKGPSLGNAYIEGRYRGAVTVGASQGIIISGDLVAYDRAADILGLAASTVEVMNPQLVRYDQVPHPEGDVIWSVPSKSHAPEEWENVLAGNISTAHLGIWPTGVARTSSSVDPHPTSDGSNVEVDATIVAANGSFRVQNWNNGPVMDPTYFDPITGLHPYDREHPYLHLYGSVAQEFRGVTSMEDGGTDGNTSQVVAGYRKDYEYNPLLDTALPPMFPGLGGTWVVKWQEDAK
jgi:Tfp pilus assembly protein PilV